MTRITCPAKVVPKWELSRWRYRGPLRFRDRLYANVRIESKKVLVGAPPQKASRNEICRIRGPELSAGAPKANRPALLDSRQGVPAVPQGKVSVSTVY